MRKIKKAFLFLLLSVMLVCTAIPCIAAEKDEKITNEIQGVDDLAGKKIGVQIGTTGDIYASDYEGDDAGTKIERFNKGADAIQALKQKKIDTVIIDEQPAKAFVQKNPELQILDEEFAVEDYAICVSKKNPELREDINQALEKLKKDGTLSDIIKNYIGDDTKGKTPYQKKEVERPNGTLTVAMNAAFQPYEYYENGVIVGIDADMMQAICDELGMKLKLEDMEFDSIITAVQSGKADVGASGMTITEERKKNIDFTDSYTTAKQVIIVNSGAMEVEKQTFLDKMKDNFLTDGRYKYLLTGLGNTLIITVFAILIGIILGFLIAIVRTNHDQNGSFTILNAVCKIYLTVVRGTPAMVQLLIIYYVVFASVNANKLVVAIIAFGLNSAAYVAEVVRSGIMAVDAGQFEAGRSLGLPYKTTMLSIILPQAVKNILPALCNEFIALLKETSISGYIGLVDLTKGGDIIRSITWEAFLPLIAVALIYLLIVMGLTALMHALERRMRNDER
ncbi:MAG: ABC transporter substrate-binding protein/permease [Lachnospiraceae bacterium]